MKTTTLEKIEVGFLCIILMSLFFTIWITKKHYTEINHWKRLYAVTELARCAERQLYLEESLGREKNLTVRNELRKEIKQLQYQIEIANNLYNTVKNSP